MGQPNCSLRPVTVENGCADSWIHLNGLVEPPPYTPSLTCYRESKLEECCRPM